MAQLNSVHFKKYTLLLTDGGCSGGDGGISFSNGSSGGGDSDGAKLETDVTAMVRSTLRFFNGGAQAMVRRFKFKFVGGGDGAGDGGDGDDGAICLDLHLRL